MYVCMHVCTGNNPSLHPSTSDQIPKPGTQYVLCSDLEFSSSTLEASTEFIHFSLFTLILKLVIILANRPFPHYVSVKSTLQHPPPPRQPPGHLTFSKIIVQIPPYLGQNAVQMPHIRIHSGDSFHRHVNDKRTAETPSIVEQNLYKYRKIIRIQYNKN